MLTFALFITAFFGGLILFDYFKTRDLARSKDLENQVNQLQNELNHVNSRLQHLEAIIADDEYDLLNTERNKKAWGNDKTQSQQL